MTIIAEAPTPTRIVFGTDGWRAADRRRVHVRERPPLRRGRRPLRRRARASRPRASSSPTTGASPRSTSRAAAAEVLLAHDIPVAFADQAVPDPDDLVRGRRAGRGGRDRHHRQPQPVDRQRLQGQVARPARPAGPDILAVIEAAIAANGGPAIAAPAVRRGRGGRARRAVRPVRGLRALRPPDARPRRAARRPTLASWSSRCGAPAPAGSRACSAAAGSGSPRSTRSATRTSAASTRSRSGRTSTRRSACSPAAATTSGCCSTATPTGPARPTSGALHPPARGRSACSCTTSPSTAACASRSSIRVNKTSMAGRLGERYGIDVLRDAGRLQVHRPEDDRDRGDDGRRGVGRLRLRDAPAGARRHLRRPAAARPVPAREGERGRWPVSKALAAFHEIAGPSFYLRVDVHVDRADYPASSGGCSSSCASSAPAELAGQPVARTVASTRTTASSSSSPTARGCSSGSAAPSRWSGSTPRRRQRSRRDAMIEAGEQLVRGDGGMRGDRPGRRRARGARREALGPRAHLGADRPLRRQDPRHRDRATPLAPVPRASRTSGSRSCPGGSSSPSRTTAGSSCDADLGAGEGAHVAPGRRHRFEARRAGRARRGLDARSSTTSSAWPTTSAAKAPRPLIEAACRAPATDAQVDGRRRRGRVDAIRPRM